MNSRFASYLLAFGLMVMCLWVIFATFVLPILPEPLAGSLSMLGVFLCLVVAAYTTIYFYEKGLKQGEEDEGNNEIV